MGEIIKLSCREVEACDSLPKRSDDLQFTTATRQRFSNLKERLLSLKMNLYLEKLLSTSQDVTGAYLNDANWFVARGNSCKLIVVLPFTMTQILHRPICPYPGFFILMKVMHTEECTTTPLHGTNYRSAEVMAKRETLIQLYTVSRS